MCNMPDIGIASSQRYEVAARLKQARRRAGYRSGREFAITHGYNVTTVLHHENGHRSFNSDTAAEYARILGVPPAWILFGETGESGEPPSQQVGICRRVGSIAGNAAVSFDADKGRDVTVLPGLKDENYDVLIVTNDSMAPFASAGDALYFQTARPLARFDREKINGAYCVVYPKVGPVVVRRVIVQSPTTVTLLALDGQPMRINVVVQRIAPIDMVRKAHTMPSADEQQTAA